MPSRVPPKLASCSVRRASEVGVTDGCRAVCGDPWAQDGARTGFAASRRPWVGTGDGDGDGDGITRQTSDLAPAVTLTRRNGVDGTAVDAVLRPLPTAGPTAEEVNCNSNSARTQLPFSIPG